MPIRYLIPLMLLSLILSACSPSPGNSPAPEDTAPTSEAAVLPSAGEGTEASSPELLPDETLPVETTAEETSEAVTDPGFCFELELFPQEVNDYGYFHIRTPLAGTYEFTLQGDTPWDLYLLEEEFDDADRYLSQANSPALSGEGTLYIEADTWIYFYCAANHWTGEEAGDDSSCRLTCR